MSIGRKKLAELGIELPPLAVTAVGSYPKPEELIKARARFARGDIDRAELRKLEEDATAMWMGFQNEIGVDVPVDGEMYRGDMVAYFAEELDGFTTGGLVRSYGNRYYRKPIISGEVLRNEPITLEWWRFAQSLTDRPVKGMLTGPYTIVDWSFNEYYETRKHAAIAFATELRKEVEALVEAGCKIVQIDEPALSVRPDELDVAVECMRVTTEGIDAYFITHACYGSFETIFPGMFGMPVDNFDLTTETFGIDLVKMFAAEASDRDLSYGVVDPHSHVVETAEVVEQRVREALDLVTPDQLWLDPDCGLKTRQVDEAQGKMRAIANAAKRVRESLRSG